jgi:hypothetical protein
MKLPRGFAAMSRLLNSELASKGGKTAHALGRAHTFTPEEARAAAKKSVEARRANKLKNKGA